MKKIILIVMVLSGLITGTAQKKEKIKGNREVLIKKFTIPTFSEIEVGEKFEIALEKSTDTTRIVIETDDNLFDVIHFSVDNEILKFNTSMEIVKKKRLRITVFVPEKFHKIRLIEKGKIFNNETLSFENLRIESIEKGKAELNLNINNNLEIEATDKSNLELEVATKNASIHLSGSATLKGKLNVKNMDIILDDHALFKMEGNGNQLKIDAQSKSEYLSPKLEMKDVVMSAIDKTTVKINVSGNIVMKLSGESETYLYGSPKINLKTFNDNAILYKK
jgi:hypothetical protein